MFDGFIPIFDGFFPTLISFIPIFDGCITIFDGFIPIFIRFIPIFDGFIPIFDGFIPIFDGFIQKNNISLVILVALPWSCGRSQDAITEIARVVKIPVIANGGIESRSGTSKRKVELSNGASFS